MDVLGRKASPRRVLVSGKLNSRGSTRVSAAAHHLSVSEQNGNNLAIPIYGVVP